jgi:hypothetical protein
MLNELLSIAELCDGVRCDMSMLLLPDVFKQTWGIDAEPFWPTAIRTLKKDHRDFLFMAEVYWDREWELIQQGFDFCYDKKLYDRLRGTDAQSILAHLRADAAFQNRLVRFLENHDEPRAAATFPIDKHVAAATIAYLVPGLRFFHQGQLEGRKNKISPHLVRMPIEPTDEPVHELYQFMLKLLGSNVVRNGTWNLVHTWEAWTGNASFLCMIAFQWRQSDGSRLLVVVNFADHASQARLGLSVDRLPSSFPLKDIMSDAVFVREAKQIAHEGLYVDLKPWGVHLFQFG